MKKNNDPLIQTNEITPEIKKSLKARVITAIGIIVVTIPCVFIGSWAYVLLGVFLAFACGFEIVKASKPSKRFQIPIYVMTIGLVESYVFWIFVKNILTEYFDKSISFDYTWWNIFNSGFNTIYISVIALVFTAIIYFLWSFLDDYVTISHVVYYIAMAALCGICLQSMLYLRFAPFSAFSQAGVDTTTGGFQFARSAMLVVYMLIAVIFNDTGAYFTGVLFGKHKVNPRISPKKTWEGIVGGVALSFLLSASFAFICAICNFSIFPILDLDHWYYIIILSLLTPIVAILGDFLFSAIKRNFEIKDFSNLLPGHGGILDRFDSILLSSAFIACFLVMSSGGWRFGIV